MPFTATWQIKRMDMEARSLAADASRSLSSKVREYRADLASLREQLKAAAAGALDGDAAARAELGLGDSYYSSSAGQRDRMLAATERLQKTSDRLQHGKQQLAETEVRPRERHRVQWLLHLPLMMHCLCVAVTHFSVSCCHAVVVVVVVKVCIFGAFAAYHLKWHHSVM
jgi:Vesicle transport v-SNARE protein N-terminus